MPHVQPPPLVTTKTDVRMPKPAAVLLAMCADPATVKTRVVRDMADNGLAWKEAFRLCSIHHRCLVEWYQQAVLIVTGKAESAVLSPQCGKLQ